MMKRGTCARTRVSWKASRRESKKTKRDRKMRGKSWKEEALKKKTSVEKKQKKEKKKKRKWVLSGGKTGSTLIVGNLLLGQWFSLKKGSLMKKWRRKKSQTLSGSSFSLRSPFFSRHKQKKKATGISLSWVGHTKTVPHGGHLDLSRFSLSLRLTVFSPSLKTLPLSRSLPHRTLSVGARNYIYQTTTVRSHLHQLSFITSDNHLHCLHRTTVIDSSYYLQPPSNYLHRLHRATVVDRSYHLQPSSNHLHRLHRATNADGSHLHRSSSTEGND